MAKIKTAESKTAQRSLIGDTNDDDRLAPESLELSSGIHVDNLVAPDGEIIDDGDNDALIAAYERWKREADKCYAFIDRLRILMAGKCTVGQSLTRRLAGKIRVAKLVFPGTEWDEKALVQLWLATDEETRDRYLKINKVGVQANPAKKLLETECGDAGLTRFKHSLSAMRRQKGGLPSITVEK